MFLTYVVAYYDNPLMLAEQYRLWASYPDDLKAQIEVVIVDDASPRWPALDVHRPDGLPRLRIYRVAVDVPWHQDGARNLGAFVAKGSWLFLTDMDHMLPAESLRSILAIKNKSRIYTFGRIEPDGTPTRNKDGELKPHINTYALTKKLYWEIGGYDEDFCGMYGTDGMFRTRAFETAPNQHCPHIPIVRHSRETIPDASTTTLPRKEGRKPGDKEKLEAIKFREGRIGKITVLDFEWERAL